MLKFQKDPYALPASGLFTRIRVARAVRAPTRTIEPARPRLADPPGTRPRPANPNEYAERFTMPNRHNIKVERDMDGLRNTVLRMAAFSEAILEKSLRAVWERSTALSAEVVRDDLAIDRLDVDIDQAVLRILALDAPVASDLRLVVAIKAIATDLERVGDLARNIAGCAERLTQREALPLPPGLHALAEESRAALSAAIRSFSELDAEAARTVLAADDSIDEQEDRLIRDAIARLSSSPETTEQEVDLIFIAQNLERIGDHATNIAEETILAAEAKNLKHHGKLARID